MEGREIERKFLVDRDAIPYDLRDADEIWTIEQDYICFSPTIRIRRINGGERHILTVKARPAGEVPNEWIREEREFLLTAEQYRSLREKCEGNTVAKTRYRFNRPDGLTEEIDVFEGTLSGLVYLEVEFPDLESAGRFEVPSWVRDDVTDRKEYRNASLALRGLPASFSDVTRKSKS